MEKVKTEEEGGNKEEVTRGRKRKKAVKVDAKETSGGGDGTQTEEVDPITATIEAVLANASSIDSSAVKPKKVKRAKKQDQEGNKTTKQDAEDVDENDDDSSAAGNKEEF